MMPLVLELSVFIYYIYLMLFAGSLSATVLSPAGVIVDGPVPLVGRIGPDEHLHVKKSCLRRCVRWKRGWHNISSKCHNRCSRCSRNR
jgi:hypothetical protein